MEAKEYAEQYVANTNFDDYVKYLYVVTFENYVLTNGIEEKDYKMAALVALDMFENKYFGKAEMIKAGETV